MNEDQAIMEYDEDDAVKYIQKHLPEELKGKFDDNEIINIIDIIYEYYDEKGLLRDDITDEELAGIEDEEVAKHVFEITKKENTCQYTLEEITLIMQGELAYCDKFEE